LDFEGGEFGDLDFEDLLDEFEEEKVPAQRNNTNLQRNGSIDENTQAPKSS